MIEVIQVYEVVVDGKMYQGPAPVWFFEEDTAAAYAKGPARTCGRDGIVRPMQAVKMADNTYRLLGVTIQVANSLDDVRRQKILAKLSVEERKLLGILDA